MCFLCRMLKNASISAQPTNDRLLTEQELLARIPVCRRTLGHYKRSGLIPYVKLRRRCFYLWDDVANSLKRQTRGGGL
jgi:hypothetical protein